MSPVEADPVFELGLRVHAEMTRAGIPCALIGAWAMLVHGHARPTRDLDIGVAVTLATLRSSCQRLVSAGFDAELHEPDPADQLGGVVDVRGTAGELVQVVNFVNSTRADETPMARAGTDAVVTAEERLTGTSLRVVRLEHLIALKLLSWDQVAARSKAANDVRALLRAHPGQVAGVAATCQRLGAGPEWRAWLARYGGELGQGAPPARS